MSGERVEFVQEKEGDFRTYVMAPFGWEDDVVGGGFLKSSAWGEESDESLGICDSLSFDAPPALTPETSFMPWTPSETAPPVLEDVAEADAETDAAAEADEEGERPAERRMSVSYTPLGRGGQCKLVDFPIPGNDDYLEGLYQGIVNDMAKATQLLARGEQFDPSGSGVVEYLGPDKSSLSVSWTDFRGLPGEVPEALRKMMQFVNQSDIGAARGMRFNRVTIDFMLEGAKPSRKSRMMSDPPDMREDSAGNASVVCLCLGGSRMLRFYPQNNDGGVGADLYCRHGMMWMLLARAGVSFKRRLIRMLPPPPNVEHRPTVLVTMHCVGEYPRPVMKEFRAVATRAQKDKSPGLSESGSPGRAKRTPKRAASPKKLAKSKAVKSQKKSASVARHAVRRASLSSQLQSIAEDVRRAQEG